MAKIIDYRDIPLDDLVLGQGQARLSKPGKDVEELAESIAVQGLLQPILVCKARKPEKWEILVGQRRFLAHRMLGKETIAAAVLDGRVEEGEAKAISITENLIRRKLSGKELKDGIRYLYNIYTSVDDVHEATGLPKSKIRGYVKYPRLIPELKEMVDDEVVDVNVALKAQDASDDDDGVPIPDVAITLAKEMQEMNGAQQKNVVRDRRDHPDKPIEDVVEDAKTGGRVVQVIATVSATTHRAIQAYASEENMNQDEALVGLIEEALSGHGHLS